VLNDKLLKMLDQTKLPLIEEIEFSLPPERLFDIFKDQPYCFFLDSALDPEKLGRYSLMGSQPFLVFQSRGTTCALDWNGRRIVEKGNPFDILDQNLKRYRLNSHTTLVPCTGGAVGYFSYDLGHFIERLPCRANDDLNLPESSFGFYDLMLIFDHLLQKAYIVSTGFPAVAEKERIIRSKERLDQLKARVKIFASGNRLDNHEKSIPTQENKLITNFTHNQYLQAVEKARQYIIEGDIFEVNLSQRFETGLPVAPYELYRRLRRINPAPFASYLDLGELKIAGSSPERFLRLDGDRVETRPIKGTIRRGFNRQEDQDNAQKLTNSPKDRAENMMIVDLARNDLGKVCRFGSVKVTELAILETYPTVFHLTSTVTGQLKAGLDQIDLLKATFPGGSITGAPKIRSMEIIEELEPTRRSVYTGSLGYLSFNGNLDLNIVIRTFLIKNNRVYFQVGGAVVYDSDPESEYQETLVKAEALFRSLGLTDGPQ
jgi:para-aminobenzoate synthetase component I